MKKSDSFFYVGHSMTGTFRECDRIKIEKCEIATMKVGDIVVFGNNSVTEGETPCVHRIVAATSDGFVTRGDNNPKNDNSPLIENNFIGRATCFERGEKIHKVWNGRAGWIRAKLLHSRSHIIRTAKTFLRRPYRMLKKSGFIAAIWQPEFETILFDTQKGPLVKYLYRGKTVANFWIHSNHWWFRRPFDIILDPKLKK